MRKFNNPNKIMCLIALFNLMMFVNLFANEPSSILLTDGTSISICDNVTHGGIIQGSESGCPNPEFDPQIITNVQLPSGGTGDLQYLWIYTTSNPLAPVTSWIPIPNSNTPDYDPGPITVETHYMRCARRDECVEYTGESNFVTKSIECCDNVTNGGMIGEDQLVCDSMIIADPITNITAPTGGTGNLEYQWYRGTTGSTFDPNSPDWAIIPGANQESLSPGMMVNTAYFIRCARREGCVDFSAKSNIVSITISQGPQIDTVLLNNVTCFGGNDGSINLVISASTGFLFFEWSDNIPPVPNPSNLSAGTYTIKLTDPLGCELIDSITLTEPAEILVETGFTTERCNIVDGGTAFVTSTVGAQGPVDYMWSLNNFTSDTIKNLGSGIYTVTVTDSLGCISTGSSDVQLNDEISILITPMAPTCTGNLDGMAVAVAAGGAGGYTYEWDDVNSTQNDTLSGVAPGIYFLTVTDSDGCETVETTTIQEGAPISIAIDATNGGCDSQLGSATATVTGGNGNYSYQWNDPSNQITQTATNLPDGTFTVNIMDSNSCSNSADFDILNAPFLQISVGKEDLSCLSGSSGSAWVNVVGGVAPISILWDNAAQSTNDTIRNLSANTYSVTVVDATGCTRTESITIDNNVPLNVESFKIDNNCSGETNGSAWVNVSGGVPPYTYLWNTTASSDSISMLANGIYSVEISDSNGCSTTIQFTIENLSSFVGTISKTDILCAGRSSGMVEFDVSGGFGTVSFEWNLGQNTQVIQGLLPGNYSVTATDGLGCEITAAATISEPDPLICDLTVLSEITTYNGNEGSLSASGSGGTGTLSYSWSNNVNTQQIDNLSAGIYSVSVTDENLCVCSDMITLDNPSKIEGYVWNDLNENGTQELTEIGLSGVTVFLSGTDNNGQTVSLSVLTLSDGLYVFDGLVEGDYTLTFSQPNDFQFTLQDVGVNDNNDSDVNPSTGIIDNVNLGEGDIQVFDAGYIMQNVTIDIGDYVWFDSNRDGIQSRLETGVPNFRVNLKSASSNAVIKSTTTNLNGKYLFSDVLPGTYYLEFDPNSLLAGYQFTGQDSLMNDALDSDVNEFGITSYFVIAANQNDDFDFDAGVYPTCDNVLNAGTIDKDQSLCGPNSDPSEMFNTEFPSGGFGTAEYLWLSSTTPVYIGIGDPNWTPIPNSNSSSYDPGPILVTTYYIRCARREGCTEYSGESNTVKKEILPLPSTDIESAPTAVCIGESANFTAESLGGGTFYNWEFRDGATPSTAASRVVNGVTWNSSGNKLVVLTATRFGCSSNDTTFVDVANCLKQLSDFNQINLETIGNVFTKISWTTLGGNDSETFFDIEKSVDKIDFETIETMIGHTNENTNQYVYSDYNLEEGMAYYRIKHYDRLGATKYSETVEIDNNRVSTKSTSRIFPNPVENTINLEILKEELDSGVFTILDVHGNIVKSLEIDITNVKNQISVFELSNGLYILKSNSNPELVFKFIVQH